MLQAFIEKHKLSTSYQEVANHWFIPLSNEIEQQCHQQKKPLIIGVTGCQGIGKTTMVEFMADYLKSTCDLNVVTFSIDDFYHTQAERKKLADRIHPLFATRGVPGTHNITLLKHVLTSLKQGDNTQIPRFNKAIDDPFPSEKWQKINHQVDVVIIEGWCLGMSPQLPEDLVEPINELEKFKDPEHIWRNAINEQLANHYVPLYDAMDKLILLNAPDFKQVAKWRWQQEQRLSSENPGGGNHGIMDYEQVKHFVSYFQRLTTHGLKTLPKASDVVFELDQNRKIISRSGTLT